MIQRWWRRFHNTRLQKKKLRFIYWFHSKFPGKHCWADCVSWSYNPLKFNPFRIDNAEACKIESKTHSTKSCYCGGWQGGVCWDKLSADEKEKIREQYRVDVELDVLPF